MKITTRTEYALRALFDLEDALKNAHVVNMEDISKRQGIPVSYLEQIFRKLRKAKIIASLRGPGGGYNLVKPLKQVTVHSVIQAVGDSPLAKPKSKKSLTSAAKRVDKILKQGDEAVLTVLDMKLGDFL